MSGDKSLKRAKKSEYPFESSDDDDTYDEEPEVFESKRDYEKLVSRPDFLESDAITRMDAKDFTMEYVHNTGLKNPIVFTGQKDVLGIKIPTFTYREVLERIPLGQRIDMFNHQTEKQKVMSVSTIVNELEKPSDKRSGPYNMLSLECSSMEMAQHIDPPKLVRELDWAQTVFPKKKFAHREYSKVEKYILMTMAGSYTEFHIDFGGTSVWYHVQKGIKYFFLVEPSENNFRIFEEWLYAYRAGTHTGFFGDVVQRCAVVKMKPDQTLILPAGWIHAVYTPVDSLVYGGNFLHEYSIGMQMKVREYESRTQIRKKFTYPFYEQTLWYVAADIVEKAMSRRYVRLIHSEEYESELQKAESGRRNDCFEIKVEPEEFYDKKDVSLDPNQLTFDAVDERCSNDPPAHFNDEFLRSMKRSLRNDLYKIKNFLQRSYDGRKQRRGRIAEGIRRPKHLLADFERVIDYVMNLNSADHEFTLTESLVKKPPSSCAEIKLETSMTTELDTVRVEQVETEEDQVDRLMVIPKVEQDKPPCLNDLNEDKTDARTPSPMTVCNLTESGSESQQSSLNKKHPRKRIILNERLLLKSKPSTNNSKSGTKHRKEEHLPLPSASSVHPALDDPVCTAVPLGKSSTRTQYKQLNLKPVKKSSSISQAANHSAANNNYNNLTYSPTDFPCSSTNYSQQMATNNFDYITEPSSVDFIDAGSNEHSTKPEFYNSTAVPCIPSSSAFNANHVYEEIHRFNTAESNYSSSFDLLTKSHPTEGSRCLSNHQAENSHLDGEEPRNKASINTIDDLLDAVKGIDALDDY